MANEGVLQKVAPVPVVVTTAETALVKSSIFPGCTDTELEMYLFACKRIGTHPLDKMLHPVIYSKDNPEKRKVVLISSIDLFRAKSDEAGNYAGLGEDEFGPDKGGYPEWAIRPVKKYNLLPNGQVETVEFRIKARWVEFYPGEGAKGQKWRDMPHVMLAKCSESQNHRAANPLRLNDVYALEEMQRAQAIDASGGTTELPQTDTVQPAQQNENITDAEFTDVETEDLQPVQDEVKLTVPQELQQVIGVHCGLDPEKMEDMLKEVSGFPDKPDGLKGFGDGQVKWRTNALKAAKELIIKDGSLRGSLPDSCQSDPTACGCPVFSDGRALCGERSSAICPFGLGRAF